MRASFVILVAALGLSACDHDEKERTVVVPQAAPAPQTTVIVPQGATVVCPGGNTAVLAGGAYRC